MSNRRVPLLDDEYYHIYNRGNNKQKIFLDNKDYLRFVKCLFICNSYLNFRFRDDIIEPKIDAFDIKRRKNLVSIGAYCLMPNHFHIYIKCCKKGHYQNGKNNISEFMHKLSTSYAKYFNKKYKRTGGIFEGTFKSVHINNDNQARYLFSYIHLNPIKLINPKWKEGINMKEKEIIDHLSSYEWSSYKDYLNIKRKQNNILNISDFPDYFSNISNFNKEIYKWIALPTGASILEVKNKRKDDCKYLK